MSVQPRDRIGADVIMNRLVALMLLAFSANNLYTAAALDDAIGHEFQNADEQLRITYLQVNSQIDSAKQAKLKAAQTAWEKYRALASEAFASVIDAKRNQEAIDRYSASLAWSRVSHLRRMTEHRDLKGSESDFRDADETLNMNYKQALRMREWREPREALRKAELAWILYRDAAIESESSVCPDPASAALYIKTELTYERSRNLRVWIARRFDGPPDLEKELYLAQLFSDKKDVLQKAIDFFAKDAGHSLPLVMSEIGMLPATVSPLFQKLGATAIPSLLDVTDKSNRAMDQMPVFLAATGPEIVPELIARISNTNNAASQMSIAALVRLSAYAEDAIPKLLEVVKSPDTDHAGPYGRKDLAVHALVAIAPDRPEVIETIIDAYIASEPGDERFTYALRKLGHAASSALPTMIERGCGSNGSSHDAYTIDGIISSEDTALIPSLIEGLVEPKGKHWPGFARALAKMGEPAVPPLKRLLQDQNENNVQRAAETLVMMKHPPSDLVDTLIALSSKRDASGSIYLLTLASRLGEAAKPAVPMLEDLYRKGRPDVRMAALNSLHAIAPDLEVVKKNWLPEPFVVDPYYDAGCYDASGQTETMEQYAIEADFNNDGVMDIAISIGTFGTGGGGWNLYLGVSPGKYKAMRDFEAPRRMTLYTREKEKGVGYLQIYWHSSAGTGTELLYRITMNGINPLQSVDVQWNENDREIPVDRNEKLPALNGYVERGFAAKVIDKKSLLVESPDRFQLR